IGENAQHGAELGIGGAATAELRRHGGREHASRLELQVGQDMGRKIGVHVVKNLMQPASVADAR
ncbi:MAG: hypothetical protein ABWY47_00860, partial [Xanthobacteraceae bacterium]